MPVMLSLPEKKMAERIIAAISAEIPPPASDWVSISALFYLSTNDRGVGNSCFAFDELGYATAFTVSNSDKISDLIRLRECHQDFPQRKWIKLLLQFGRNAEQIRLQFDFLDPWKWTVTTDNYKHAIRELKPEFDDTKVEM